MKIAIQQPEHLPWIGFFNKMAHCDLFVYLNHVQFKKRYFENRNKIKNGPEFSWVTVPVCTKGRYSQPINEVEVDGERAWKKKYKGQLEHAYSKSAFWKDVQEIVYPPLEQPCTHIEVLNLALIENFRDYLEIDTPFKFSSEEISDRLKGSELILEICLKMDAKIYISGPDGRGYLNQDMFRQKEVKIVYHEFNHPVYSQEGDQFLSHLSVVDLIANCGKESSSIIKNNFKVFSNVATEL